MAVKWGLLKMDLTQRAAPHLACPISDDAARRGPNIAALLFTLDPAKGLNTYVALKSSGTNVVTQFPA